MPHNAHYFNRRTVRDLLDRLTREGAVCIGDLVKRSVIEDMQYELMGSEGEVQKVDIGTAGVKQHFSLIPMPSVLSITHDVCISLDMYINDLLLASGYKDAALHFNDFRIQRYEAHSPGITPHRDFKSDRGLIALLCVAGEARFGICEDRDGRGVRAVRNEPGDLVLMRGYQFLGIEERPMHFVDNIRSTRVSIGLRCKAE